MPSSISSSDVRLTASDRPGIAQPVPVREVPSKPWALILGISFLLVLILVGAWEAHWRATGTQPSIRNSDSLWAKQRRRLDSGEGNSTVLLGDSRVLFDIQLDVWQQLSGQRPIQLAFEGTSPITFMEDLAEDPKFTGRLLIGISPFMFFNGFSTRAGALKYFRHESLSQRAGQWLSQNFIEPFAAFDDPDFALATVLRRQAWRARPGMPVLADVRKNSVMAADRDTHLWNKIELDPAYGDLARSIWTQRFTLWRVDPPPAKMRQTVAEQIDRAAKAAAKLRARGVKIVFVRMPSSGPFLALENERYPRRSTWDRLLSATGEPGIHFEDEPTLQGYDLPEWSHVTQAEGERLTRALYRIIERDFWRADNSTLPAQ